MKTIHVVGIVSLLLSFIAFTGINGVQTAHAHEPTSDTLALLPVEMTINVPVESDDFLSHLETLPELTDTVAQPTVALSKPQYPLFRATDNLAATPTDASPILPINRENYKGISTYFSFYHPGIDIMADLGTPIHTMLPGVVQTVSYEAGGYGKFIVVTHTQNNGKVLYSLYAHMRQTLVTQGQTVSAGQEIGEVGLTGHTTGPHVHFEVHDNSHAVNPLNIVSVPTLALAR